MIWVPNLLVHFVSLDLLHAETPVQVWLHFLIFIRTISPEDLLKQQTAIIDITISTLVS